MTHNHPSHAIPAKSHMKFGPLRGAIGAALVASLVLLASGCAVQRGQETMGAYLDDTGITTSVKSRLFDNRLVDGIAISVETLNGTVMLSGFAKSNNERSTAERLAREVKGVTAVKNEISVRP